MAEPTPSTIDFERARHDAFSAWWNADYSLEGLKKKKAATTRGLLSLYDYWFDGRGLRIVEFAGRTWTIFHLPMTDLAGNKSEKAAWNAEQVEAFYSEIFQREEDAERNYNKSGITREDLKPIAFFDGVVFPFRPRPTIGREVSPSYKDAFFCGSVEIGKVASTNLANFQGAVFCADVSCVGRTFHNGAQFDRALFFGFTDFSNCNFGTKADFEGAQFFGQANFRNAACAGPCEFSGATVMGNFGFEGSVSGPTALDGARFEKAVSFGAREFTGQVSMRNTVFGGSINFKECKFGAGLSSSATFSGPADFSCRSGGQFGDDVQFHGAHFSSSIDFSGRAFLRPTRFVSCKFERAPMFFGAEPHPSTSFSGSQFLATIGDLSRLDEMVRRLLEKGPGPLGRVFHQISPLARFPKLASWVFRWVPFAEWLPAFAAIRRERDAATKVLEDSYRTLRHLFEADSELAGRFYSLEMDTRRNRRDVSMVERWLLYLFALSSGYGRYLGRALLTLLGALLLVTALAWFAIPTLELEEKPGRWGGEVFAQVWRMFLLPAPFPQAVDPAKSGWVAELIKSFPVSYVLLSGFCALVTAGVVGVSLVTLRRRFALK